MDRVSPAFTNNKSLAMKLKYILITLIFFQFLTFQANAITNDFKLTSSDIARGKKISTKHVFNGFGCTGENISPQLVWSNAPKDTKSFALTVYDPDAPTGSGWWHWVVANIPAEYSELPANFGEKNSFKLEAADKAINQIRNDFGIYSFGGPCPPQGDKPHRYIFTIHALKVEKLDLNDEATAALAGFMINANTIAKARLISTYSR
jgi:Raf kinase inhibitor-like YbhB/YbcL family protein